MLVFSILALTAVAGLSEVTGDWGNDAIAYHLLGPKVWLRNGIIRPVPDNCHTAFPPTAETLYAVLLAIGGARAPGFSSVATLGLLLAISSSLAVRCGLDAKWAWWVAALVSTMPAIYSGSIRCFVDGLYAAFVLAAIRVGFDAEQTRHWASFGVFCGLVMGTKYTGILAFPALVLFSVATAVAARPKDWRRASRGAALGAALACTIAAPYYLRNWIFLGCPIYPPPPGLARMCSPKYLSPEAVNQFHAYIWQRGGGLGRDFFAFVLLPFNLTYHTSNFHGGGGIGLCPLGLAPLGLIASRRNLFVNGLAVLAFILVSIWFLTQQESRFLIHVYVLVAIVAVIGWDFAISTGKLLSKTLAATLVAVSIGYGIFMIGKQQSDEVRSVFSPAFAELKSSRDIPFRQSFQYLNRSPEVNSVLILDRSVPPFYCDKEYIKPIGQWGERILPGVLTPADALQHIDDLKVSHVLDVNSDVAPFQIAGSSPKLILVFEAKDQRIYRVNRFHANDRSLGQKTHPNVWLPAAWSPDRAPFFYRRQVLKINSFREPQLGRKRRLILVKLQVPFRKGLRNLETSRLAKQPVRHT